MWFDLPPHENRRHIWKNRRHMSTILKMRTRDVEIRTPLFLDKFSPAARCTYFYCTYWIFLACGGPDMLVLIETPLYLLPTDTLTALWHTSLPADTHLRLLTYPPAHWRSSVPADTHLCLLTHLPAHWRSSVPTDTHLCLMTHFFVYWRAFLPTEAPYCPWRASCKKS